MQSDKNTKGKLSLFLFFIHPFFAFLIALRHLKSKHSQLVLLLFFTLFGYTFIAENEAADSFHYIAEFNSYLSSTSFSYIRDINEYLTFETSIKDIYTITTYFLVSRFTSNYHVLMAVWAFIFSLFFLKAFKFFTKRPEFKKSIYTAILVFLFIFSNNIFNINGVRFWTAAWLSVYVIFEVIVNKNSIFILLSFIAPLIHVSYIVLPIILLLSTTTNKFEKAFVYLFIISFLFGELSVQLVQNYKSILPQTFQNIIWSYTESDLTAERVKSIVNEPLYARILNAFPRFLLNIFMIMLILRKQYFKMNKEAYAVFMFLLLWLSFCNFTMAIPSFGGRFMVLAFPLMAYLLLLTYSNIKILKKSLLLIPIAFSYVLFIWLRQMILVTDPYLILSFFPHILLKDLF